mgnify:FL=1
MDLFIAFGIFIVFMVLSLIAGISTIPALLLGLLAFLTVGRRKGFSLKSMFYMSMDGIRNSLVVIEVMLIIGLITAVWRVSGTITIFVYYGMKIIVPPLFLLIAFFLSCLLSYALGTSFGTAGTVGVIFMTLARSGGVDPVITAGVIMSGIYFGDRCSPVSSSANLVAGITGTKVFDNVKLMMKTAMVPLLLTTVFYGVLSFFHPVSHMDDSVINAFEEEFTLSLWSFIPAVIVILLPILRADVIKAMGLSIAAGIIVACLIQKVSLPEVLKICIIGYEAPDGGLGSILDGGGLVSMAEVAAILIISSSYSGIFSGTDMLTQLQEKIVSACSRLGRFTIMIFMSIATAAVFCNQTIATLMCADLMKKPYLSAGGTHTELAIDMENSVILIACIIPWTIGCTIPLSFMEVGISALPYAFYMYAVPLYYWIRKGRFTF